MTMAITMRAARMRMRLTIMMAITTRTKRRTMKTGRMMITVMMTFILRQQQKILKTCWTERSKFSRRERSRAREDISLVPHLILNPSSPHTHTPCFVWKNNPGKYNEEYEQQTREDLWR